MGTIAGILILCLMIWMLFIKGALFRLILAIFAFIGMRSYLFNEFPNSRGTFMNVMNTDVNYATFIPLVIIILAMATTGYNER